MNKSARININCIQEHCNSSGEAQEVMLAAVLVNQYDTEVECENAITDPLAQIRETLRSNALKHSEAEDDEDDDLFNDDDTA